MKVSYNSMLNCKLVISMYYHSINRENHEAAVKIADTVTEMQTF